jgi:pimeloyl-ACP methyl ester carboxylesterase
VIVVLHGLGRHPAEWSDFAEDAIVPDLPELRTAARPDTRAAIARVLAALDAHGIARATWLGHSFGAHLAVEAAHRCRDRIDRLILVAAAPSLRALDDAGVPTLVVLGALDGIQVAGGWNVEVEVLADVGHDPHLEAPQRLREVISRWRG